MKIILNQAYSFMQLGKRNNQQDFRFPDCDEPQEYKPYFLVCDGVGGSQKGDIASQTVCSSFEKSMKGVNFDKLFSAEDFAKKLSKMYTDFDNAAKEYSANMATTMTFVCFHRDGVMCAHIGDSRIYHIRPNEDILYRSEDHSLVNTLARLGNITPDEAINHPQSNYITRAVDYKENKNERSQATAVQITDIKAGDYFFLCTDGVVNMIDDGELFRILSSDISDKEKIKIIAQLSEQSLDNNTAYLIGIKEVKEQPQETYSMQDGGDTVPMKKQDKGSVNIKAKTSFFNIFKSLF